MKHDQVEIEVEVENFSALTLALTFYFSIIPFTQLIDDLVNYLTIMYSRDIFEGGRDKL
jgi:hypothetical protein